ncbi:hypothetical protein VTL71DRAFT_12568 [Oculimacula yallundae]|uniref:Uncharacterized protein n=1 Tax=Oculimacula yallundae TaxID=86028 RepID=A0ABR4CPR0_9HELO
MAIPPLEP